MTTNLTVDFGQVRTDHSFIRGKSELSFYSNRVVSIWNRLPTDLRQEQSLDGFVRKLNSFYYLKFQTLLTMIVFALGQVLVDVRRVRDIWIIIINM